MAKSKPVEAIDDSEGFVVLDGGVGYETPTEETGSDAPEITVAPEAPEKTEGADETTVYVGPNVLPLGLKRFQVFRGGIPPYVARAIENISEVKGLIVPVSELENMRRKIEKPGTNEARLFDAVQTAASKMRK